MRILVLGAYGLIGSAVTRRLAAAGHQVTGLGRDVGRARARFPEAAWIAHDIAALSTPGSWAGVIEGCDAVVNCAGALQPGPRDDVEAVQSTAMKALFHACERAGPRRVVQVSAVGVAEGADTLFMRSKAAADACLRERDLDWVILRPGLVLSPEAYGATALVRALAAFPFAVPLFADESRLQTVHVDDVARAVQDALEGRVPARAVYDLVEEGSWSLSELVLAFRAWLGVPGRRVVRVPGWLGRAAFAAGDVAGRLGWRSPLRSTALASVRAGIVGDPRAWTAASGWAPRGLPRTLAALPSTVQERWFARAWTLKPAIILCLALFWAASGAVGLLRLGEAAGVLEARGVSSYLSIPAVVVFSAIDLALGAWVLVRGRMRRAAWGMVLVSAGYLAAGTVLTPDLWADPLGPFVKVLPAAMLALVLLALAEDR